MQLITTISERGYAEAPTGSPAKKKKKKVEQASYLPMQLFELMSED